jgi:3-hydroxymyristoyl/3-hydroxydecanoyl-(acyl carrier protein) dehydratase
MEAEIRAGRKKPLFTPRPEHAVDLGRADVEKLLHHRDPFLFIDRITAVDRESLSIECRRRIDPADPVFVGHFPGEPIYPGVLQMEAIGQAALCLEGILHGLRSARALKVHHAVFLEAVRPADELVIAAKSFQAGDYTAVWSGQILRDDVICCFSILEVYFA